MSCPKLTEQRQTLDPRQLRQIQIARARTSTNPDVLRGHASQHALEPIQQRYCLTASPRTQR
eukprot:5812816-Pyramimonas_sp.AAC.1